ncbi:MAG: hypothetical protein RLZZ47_279 [Bacteroidota bacterium]
MATSISSSPTPTFSFNQKHYKIGVVTAAWNNHITSILHSGALDTLSKMQEHQLLEVVEVSVPGAFEIPTAAQWLFESGCDAVINLGCVIKGDTPHFDFVCNAVTDGIGQLALKHSKPCIFGVITTNTEQQAFDRAGGALGNKGSEAAEAAIWMLLAKHSVK